MLLLMACSLVGKNDLRYCADITCQLALGPFCVVVLAFALMFLDRKVGMETVVKTGTWSEMPFLI